MVFEKSEDQKKKTHFIYTLLLSSVSLNLTHAKTGMHGTTDKTYVLFGDLLMRLLRLICKYTSGRIIFLDSNQEWFFTMSVYVYCTYIVKKFELSQQKPSLLLVCNE